jgi:hypothetical protein
VKRLISSDHFSVDGTLLEAWASTKSFRKLGGGDPAKAGPQRRARLPQGKALQHHAPQHQLPAPWGAVRLPLGARLGILRSDRSVRQADKMAMALTTACGSAQLLKGDDQGVDAVEREVLAPRIAGRAIDSEIALAQQVPGDETDELQSRHPVGPSDAERQVEVLWNILSPHTPGGGGGRPSA